MVVNRIAVNQHFIRFFNQHIQGPAKDLGLETVISAYYIRHTFTTTAIRNGAKIELIQESLGHHSLSANRNHCAGFEEEVKKQSQTT